MRSILILPALLVAVLTGVECHAQGTAPNYACGLKIGELTQDAAIIWVRLTESAEADFARLYESNRIPDSTGSNIESLKQRMPLDVVPGIPGSVRIRYWPNQNSESARWSKWMSVDEHTDFVHQFRLEGLAPDTSYQVELEASADPSVGIAQAAHLVFTTAPAADQSKPIQFVVTTCQAIRSADSPADGHIAYKQMMEFQPDFFVHTGDIVYYDKKPLAKSVAEANVKWNVMFAYRHNRELLRNVPSYFMKDDHDTLKNDCWPGQRYGELTFDQGLAIFRNQVSMGEKTYRTFRWGKDLQIWMTENRDFRSSNRDPDGPSKTILGIEQKRWLKQTLAASDATFKFVISPGPLVGPDKRGKADNHSNAAFAHEGRQLRQFIAAQPNTYVICGDRHWQYCSRDPETGLIEMGCGPINDQHSFGGNPGKDPGYHRYFSAKGGFLGITVDGGRATAEWFNSNDVDAKTGRPRILHSEQFIFVENK